MLCVIGIDQQRCHCGKSSWFNSSVIETNIHQTLVYFKSKRHPGRTTSCHRLRTCLSPRRPNFGREYVELRCEGPVREKE